MKSLRVVDLCCGGGLFSAGMERAGLKVIMGVDMDPVALSSFQENFSSAVAWEMDLLDLNSLPRCDVVIGGPPCQPFSRANRNPNHSEGMVLVDKFIGLVKASGCRYWIMEEVPPVAEYVKGRAPRCDIWDCSSFGARNVRPRMFAGEFPDPIPSREPCLNPSSTVLASENNIPLTVMRDLQGVPSWMVFSGCEGDQRRQIGNGVPLEMGEALGLGIVLHARGDKVEGHRPWHRLRASYHRREGGNRAYLSDPKSRYCLDCKETIKL